MRKNGILVVKESFENIQRCCQGVVYIHYRGVPLHFGEEVFLSFASMAGVFLPI